jgi:hypothetical protein
VICSLILVFYSYSISAIITRWVNVNRKLSADGELHPAIRSAERHSNRLLRYASVIAAGYILRAACWSMSSITKREKGPYPAFYPLCFYQIPVTLIAAPMLCIVGNLDNRVRAVICSCFLGSLHPGAETLRVSYCPPAAEAVDGEKAEFSMELGPSNSDNIIQNRSSTVI